jgi:hypothetical protein
MNYILLILSITSLLIVLYFRKEGFNPYQPEQKPENYPDQSKEGKLIEIAKYIQYIKDSNNTNEEQKLHLEDLLNLIQFI